MNFKVNTDYMIANGTSLQGYVRTSYDRLVSLLGEPDRGSGKITAEWIVEFEDGTVATIYDWKEYSTPLGSYDWHIGGHDQKAVDRVHLILGYSQFYYKLL